MQRPPLRPPEDILVLKWVDKVAALEDNLQEYSLAALDMVDILHMTVGEDTQADIVAEEVEEAAAEWDFGAWQRLEAVRRK